MKIRVSLFAFSLGFLTAQSSDPVIGWLTRLQAVQATLRMLPDTAAADLQRADADIRLLRREVESHPETQEMNQNAFDRNFFLVDGYPEAGRTIYLNLRYRF